MNRKARHLLLPGAILAAGLFAACAPQPAFTPTATKTPEAAIAFSLTLAVSTPTSIPATATDSAAATSDAATPIPTIDASPTEVTPTDTPPPPTPDDGLPPDHYVMARPIPSGWVDYADRTYPYGSTGGGQYRPHAGFDFADPASTPVVAVAPSTVEYAGPDWDVMFGPELRFYGNLIVLRITGVADGNGQPVFALYGHLSEIYVKTGDTVATGDIIGAVGGTGVANGGAHLHLEVRVGDPHDYNLSTRNPDLWIKPYFGYGTLAGKVVDGSGALLPNVSITVRGADTTRYTSTYAGAINHADATWGENFTLGDLPEGWYTVTTRSSSRTYSEDIYIRPNRTTWVEFDFN